MFHFLLYSLHQLAGLHIQRIGDVEEGFQSRFPLATFYGAQVRPADPGHTADDQWSSDETGHWHICTACAELFQFDAHTPGDDGLCGVCGFAQAPTQEVHTHAGEGDWITDEGFHWKRCQCAEDMEKEAHVWEASGKTCTICGAEKPAEPVEAGSNLGILTIVLAVLLILAVGLCVVLILLIRKKPAKYGR